MFDRQTDRPNYDSVDLAKFIGAFLVIAIHTNIFISFSDTLNYYFVNLFCRLAVYFYFIASAYFFFNSLLFENGKIIRDKNNLRKLKKYVFRVLLLYVIWSAVYLIYDLFVWYDQGCLTLGNFKGYVLSFFTASSHYHLWFVISLIYAIPIMYFVLRFLGVRVLVVASLILYIIGLCYGNYGFMGASFGEWYSKFANIWPRLSTVLFSVIPICSLCFICDKIKVSGKTAWVCAVLFLAAFSVEGMLLYFNVSKNTSAFLIFTLPAVLFIFTAVKNTNISLKHSFEVRKLSTIIYCLHPLVIALLGLAFDSKNINSVLNYLIISAITIMAAFVILVAYKKLSYAKFLKYIM